MYSDNQYDIPKAPKKMLQTMEGFHTGFDSSKTGPDNKYSEQQPKHHVIVGYDSEYMKIPAKHYITTP